MSKRITLKEAAHIHIGHLADLSADQLLDLQQQASENLEKAKRAKDWIDGAIHIKYSNQAKRIKKTQALQKAHLKSHLD